MDCDTLVHDEAKEWTVDSNEALAFKLVRSKEDMNEDFDESEDNIFDPEMTHQIYGQNEEIYGYKGLKVHLYASAAKLKFYCDINYDEKIKPKRGEPEADDLVKPLADLLPANCILDNRGAFLSSLADDAKFKPFGEQLHRFTKDIDGEKRTFEVYKCNITEPGFSDHFERLQMFVMFFVDAASLIDLEDDNWNYFVAYELYKSPSGDTRYAVAGYTVVYQFYAYPDLRRPRISQMLVLPPFQRMGVGSALLKAVYGAYMTDSVKSITVEGPSDVFSHMKLLLDCRNCLALPAFAPARLFNGVSKDQYEEALKKLKLGKEPVQKITNVLRLNHAKFSSDPSHYKAFRRSLRWQLGAPFRRQDRDRARMQRHGLSAEEMSEVMTLVPVEQREQFLEAQCREEEERMMRVVEQLPRATL